MSNKERVPESFREPISERETIPEAPPVVTYTLAELAEKHGHSFVMTTSTGLRVRREVPDSDPYKTDHMMASTAHGWIPHEHNWGLVRLSDDDYLKALEAAKDGRVHAPANKRPKK